MHQEAPDVERRLTEIQSQINRLSLSLHLWRERQDRVQPMESRLAQLTEQCSEIVDRWALTGERHAHAVVELERVIEHEWSTVRESHEEPVKQLQAQAAHLTDAAVAAASQAISGFDRAEARLAVLEKTLHQTLTELSGQIQSAVAELRSLTQRPALPPDASSAWPLDGVVRLHNQLRESNGAPVGSDPLLEPQGARLQLPEASTALAERLETLERSLGEDRDAVQAAVESGGRSGRLSWAAVALLAVGIGAGGVFLTRLQRQIDAASAQVVEAQREATAATEVANQQIKAARDDAARQIAEARETALKAQTISDVLAAPDLVRYNLVGKLAGAEEAVPFTAQALWSRSRGLVFSGSRLPPPPPDSIYQIWLLTNAAAVSAGTFVPDGGGRFTMATTTPPKVPPPLWGVSVTIEQTGGSERPTGLTLLARAEPPTDH